MLLALVGLGATGLALALYLGLERVGPMGIPLALLRAASWGALAALLVNPSCRRAGRGGAGTTVLLDQSLSMTDPAGDARWRAAVDSAKALAGRGGRVVLFGAEPRVFDEAARPVAAASRLGPALREAAARGGPIAVVTDGAIDDPAALPGDLLRRARVVLLARAAGRDAGVAGLDLPAALRAGDTATATVDVIAAGTSAPDSVTVELLERGRPVARERLGLGAGGALRRDLRFVPAPAASDREVRRYEVRLAGLIGDVEPRDDARASLAEVSRGSAIVLLTDSPDWDSRALATALAATAGVPLRAWVRVGKGGAWHDARTLRPRDDVTVRGEASRAALVIAHGTEDGVEQMARLGRRAVWRWVTAPRSGVALLGDWYVAAPDLGSPVGGALASAPPESLPPLEAVSEPGAESGPTAWVALAAQLDRRGRPRPVVQGAEVGGLRVVTVSGAGLWRWASRGGVAAEAYRALVASLTDWLLEERPGAQGSLAAARDSLARGQAEFLPRPPLLRAQPGVAAEAEWEPVPLRHAGWVYGLALGALVLEWVARRRQGLR